MTSRSGRPPVSPVQQTGRSGEGTGYPVTQANTKPASYEWHSNNCQQQMWDTWPEPHTSHKECTGRRIFSRGELQPLHQNLANEPWLSWSSVKYLLQPTSLISMWLHSGEPLAKFSTQLATRQLREKPGGDPFVSTKVCPDIALQLPVVAKARRSNVAKTPIEGTGSQQWEVWAKCGKISYKLDQRQVQLIKDMGLPTYRQRDPYGIQKRRQPIHNSYRTSVPPYPPTPHVLLKPTEAGYLSYLLSSYGPQKRSLPIRNSYQTLVPPTHQRLTY